MLTWADLGETVMDLQQVYSIASLEWLSLQVRITIEVPSPDALLNIIFEDYEEPYIEDIGYQGYHLLKLTCRIASFSNSSTSKVSETLKSKPSPSSQVLGRSVYALDLREESSSDPATSKAELEFVKNIFSVINQLPDYLHPCFNLWIDFFLLVRNSQNRRETMESIHNLFRIISNPSQE
nr:hypothetical protein Iba_chr04aCG22100 [Ipomoea batatas]